ncbi:MAG: prepilin-type N-terminal cleavage/methylation domain-containing protein, partial [Gemmatimonadaceae bacterium]|nr:prepilin-type N-terminal cleavage/methylation domain-containing protein [Gemmatimonadaceae bacterium]
MRSLPLRSRSAFTVIELLVACLVLGTGVLALASTSVAVA